MKQWEEQNTVVCVFSCVIIIVLLWIVHFQWNEVDKCKGRQALLNIGDVSADIILSYVTLKLESFTVGITLYKSETHGHCNWKLLSKVCMNVAKCMFRVLTKITYQNLLTYTKTFICVSNTLNLNISIMSLKIILSDSRYRREPNRNVFHKLLEKYV